MAVPNLNFDPETVAMMGHVCDEVWLIVQATMTCQTTAQEQALRSDLARLVMAAVVAGERDSERLLQMALDLTYCALLGSPDAPWRGPAPPERPTRGPGVQSTPGL